MIINHNLMAMNTHRQISMNNLAGAKLTEKLSSGFRINRAGDDAAGLAISEKMRGHIRGLNMASRNAQDAISLIQTAEGALTESHAILQRMRELAVQSANDTNTDNDREHLQKEIEQLITELDRIARDTEFNQKKLLDGTYASGGEVLTFHIGANEGQNITLNISKMDASGIGVDVMSISTQPLANTSFSTFDVAIMRVSAERAKLGAVQNRLEHTIRNLDNTAENLQAAEARIRDLDIAKEMMEFTKNSILQQAATVMLAHANMAPQSVLQLLR